MKTTTIKLRQLIDNSAYEHNFTKSELNELFGDINVRLFRDIVDNEISGYGIVTTTIFEANPDVAKALLKLNTNNREINKLHVNNIANAYLNDSKKHKDKAEAVFNGDAIVINRYGVLADGQQRLMAVIQNGLRIPFNLIIGVSENSIYRHDCGVSRNSTIALKKNKFDKASTIASTVKYKYAYLNNRGMSENVLKYQNRTGLTNEDVIFFYEHDKSIDDSIEIAYANNRKLKGLLNPAQIAGIHNLILMGGDKERADHFINKLGDNLNHVAGSPILALRNLLIKLKNDNNYHLSKGQITWAVLYSWNNFVQDKPISRINVRERTKKSDKIIILDVNGKPIDFKKYRNIFYNFS